MQGWTARLDHALKMRRVNKLHALAVELGVDESALSRWRRSRSISLDNAVNLCRVLDVSLDWLVMGRGHILAHRSEATRFEQLTQELFLGLPDDRAVEALDALLKLARAVYPGNERG